MQESDLEGKSLNAALPNILVRSYLTSKPKTGYCTNGAELPSAALVDGMAPAKGTPCAAPWEFRTAQRVAGIFHSHCLILTHEFGSENATCNFLAFSKH